MIISAFLFKVPGEPQNVHASAINSSSVEVVWDPPADRDRNGVIRGYQIYVQPKNPVSGLQYANLSMRGYVNPNIESGDGGRSATYYTFFSQHQLTCFSILGVAVLLYAVEVQHQLRRHHSFQRQWTAAGHPLRRPGRRPHQERRRVEERASEGENPGRCSIKAEHRPQVSQDH